MDNLNFGNGNSLNLSNCGAVAGTTSTFTTTSATNAALNGKFTVALGIQTNAATPVLDSTTGLPFIPVLPGFACTIVFGVTAAGALTMSQSTPIALSAGSGNVPGPLINDPQFPEVPQLAVALAYTVVRTAPNAAPWTPGVGAWAATGVVASTFQNVVQLPNRPQAS
jgi:hypothetical protein